MNDFDYLHEAEDVWLISMEDRCCGELWQVLKRLGFEVDEDVFTIDRLGKLPMWQTRSIVAVHVFLDDQEVYDEDGRWNRVKLRYLMATLPSENLSIFVEAASSVAMSLGLTMEYRDQAVSKAELAAALNAALDELRVSVGEPGTKEVAIAIEMTYPRRR
ncbi:MAG: hypothetical protein KBF48_14435 [Xanthomonadales bacterium]|nr:hypothetical protein [Xanthomonadales bacterium]MBP9156134.1 hypothetical protein [Xanthomonadales bacterium]